MVNWNLADVIAHESKSRPKHIPAASASAYHEKEGNLHAAIIQYCKSKGWYYVHSRMDRQTTTAIGVPDFILALPNGVVWWIECKAKGKKLTPEQLSVGVMLNHLHQNYAVVYSMEEFMEIVRPL